jgi:hypothetical protein
LPTTTTETPTPTDATTDANVAGDRRARRMQRLMERPWTARARRSRALRRELDRRGMITPHFTWRSYACTDGTPVPQSLRANAVRLHWKLESLRHGLGDIPIIVDGPYRTEQRNRQVGGAQGSRHVHADAADFFAAQVDSWVAKGRAAGRGARSRDDVLAMSERIFRSGGVGNETSGTLHLDARGWRARFVTWMPSR